MSKTIIPEGYKSSLNLFDTQVAIGKLKRIFEDNLAQSLNLKRVSAPLFVDPEMGINDNLSGVERPVSFDVPEVGKDVEIVHSLAKWKRIALKKYDFRPGRGLYTFTDVDMKTGTPSDYSSINRSGSVAEYNNVNIASAGGGVAAADGAKVVFNSGSVDVSTTSTSGRYLFYAEGAGSEIVINGGTFSFSKTLNQKRAYVYAGTGTKVIINGGTFGPASTRSGYTAGLLGDGEIIITGGTFGFDPTKWVADGYKAVKTGNTWVVSAE